MTIGTDNMLSIMSIDSDNVQELLKELRYQHITGEESDYIEQLLKLTPDPHKQQIECDFKEHLIYTLCKKTRSTKSNWNKFKSEVIAIIKADEGPHPNELLVEDMLSELIELSPYNIKYRSFCEHYNSKKHLTDKQLESLHKEYRATKISKSKRADTSNSALNFVSGVMNHISYRRGLRK